MGRGVHIFSTGVHIFPKYKGRGAKYFEIYGPGGGGGGQKRGVQICRDRPQGTARHSPAPCRLSLLRDRVSEYARYPSFSILLYMGGG